MSGRYEARLVAAAKGETQLGQEVRASLAAECEAHVAIRTALEALRLAYKLSEGVGYGSEVLGSLAHALEAAEYASNTAEGRT